MLTKSITYYELEKLFIVHNINHFSPNEVIATLYHNENLEIPLNLIDNLIMPLTILDTMRETLGFPIKLNSTYRDDKGNKHAKGVKNSMHCIAGAIDSRPLSRNSTDLQRMFDWINRVDRFTSIAGLVSKKDLGKGFYPTFLHLDCRGLHGRHSPVSWSGS